MGHNQLFTWKECRGKNLEKAGYKPTYYEVTLRKTIFSDSLGEFKVGTFFDAAEVDYDNGYLSLWKDRIEYNFRLTIYAL